MSQKTHMEEPHRRLEPKSCARMRNRWIPFISTLSEPRRRSITTETMTARDHEEYRALRATIRERGTARVCIFAGGIVAWAAATIATAALASTPLATLLPLLVLASVFEAVFALHIGVERIGRYLQVFHETDPPALDLARFQQLENVKT